MASGSIGIESIISGIFGHLSSDFGFDLDVLGVD